MRLHVSSSPHIRDPVTTRRLMLDVVIALSGPDRIDRLFWLSGCRCRGRGCRFGRAL